MVALGTAGYLTAVVAVVVALTAAPLAPAAWVAAIAGRAALLTSAALVLSALPRTRAPATVTGGRA